MQEESSKTSFKVRGNIMPTGIVLAILLGLLLYASDDALIYSIIISLIRLAQVWGSWILHGQIKLGAEMVFKEESSNKEANQLALAFTNFYLKRPHISLMATMMFISLVAFAFALYSKFGDVSHITLRHYSLICSFSLLIISIIIDEIVNQIWRRARNKEMPS